ncbi:hypothetical protein MK489_17845 [Myxococcota bacterium]|nr:hypothetical protein [Myxococcota bacterium]
MAVDAGSASDTGAGAAGSTGEGAALATSSGLVAPSWFASACGGDAGGEEAEPLAELARTTGAEDPWGLGAAATLGFGEAVTAGCESGEVAVSETGAAGATALAVGGSMGFGATSLAVGNACPARGGLLSATGSPRTGTRESTAFGSSLGATPAGLTAGSGTDGAEARNHVTPATASSAATNQTP